MCSLHTQETNLLSVLMNKTCRPPSGQSVPLWYLHILFSCQDFQLLCVVYFSECSYFFTKSLHHCDIDSSTCISSLNFTPVTTNPWSFFVSLSEFLLLSLKRCQDPFLSQSFFIKPQSVPCDSSCNSHSHDPLKPYSVDFKLLRKLQSGQIIC